MLLVMLISAALLALAICCAVNGILNRRSAARRYALALAPVFVVLSIAVLRYPLYYFGEAAGYVAEGRIAGGLHGIVSGLQTIGLNESLSELMDRNKQLLSGSSVTLWVYNVYTALQYALALPICGASVIGAILRFGVRAQLAVTTRPVYFFSKLTEEAVILAQSIGESARHGGAEGEALFCFCVPEDDGEYKSQPYWQRARHFGAIAMPGKLTAELFPRGSAHVTCVLCSPDENENVKDLSRLLGEEAEDARAKRQTVKHFVFGSSAWAEKAVDALAASCEKDPLRAVFMLNPKENLAVHILHQYPLYARCAKGEGGRARLNVLVVGSTPLADWFLRTAYACGQLCDCDLSITLADTDAQAYRERLLLAAPMLQREDHPLLGDLGALRFVQLGQLQAAAAPALLADKDYIFLALEADEDNAMLAGQIASVINRQKLTDSERAAQRVSVLYAVQDAGLSRLCGTLSPERTDESFLPCEVIPVGDRESRYRVDVLLEHELLHRAYFVSLAYAHELTAENAGNVDKFAGFTKRAYGRLSSTACALQMEYYHQMLARGGKDMAAKLEDAEHRRWSAYMIMDGYDEPTREELAAYLFRGGNKHKSDSMRLHPCLVTGRTDALERLAQELDVLLIGRLQEEFAAAGVDFRPPQGEREAVLAAVDRAAKQVKDKDACGRIMAMKNRLYMDYRAADSEILRWVGDIMAMMENKAIQSALNRYWQ